MSREIKFRAWVVPLSEMFSHDKMKNATLEYINNPQRHIFMQCTGLKDKNGVEIYEGDIVQTYEGYSWKVLWGATKASFYAIGCGENNKGARSNIVKVAKGEIIGNIHQDKAKK